jgi:peptide/nickel transport system ATP-binding protein
MNNDTILEIRDLHVQFKVYGGHLRVLDGVSLQARSKEKVGLVGETGCGKTITMKATIRVLPIPPGEIVKGEILFEGKDVLKMSRKELRYFRGKKIAMIPQDPTASLNPVFKIGTQLIDAIRYSASSSKGLTRKEIIAKAIEILEEVGLPDPKRNMDNYPIQLSGGMKQRVLIAMALVTGSDLLFADEPTTALDVTIQDQILRLMREMVERREVSMLLITHNFGSIRELTDRTYVMYAGQVVEVAETNTIFSDPLHPYTKALLDSVPRLTGGGMAPGIAGMIPNYMDPPCGCRFQPRCDHAMRTCTQKPPLQQIAGEHKVACFLYKE